MPQQKKSKSKKMKQLKITAFIKTTNNKKKKIEEAKQLMKEIKPFQKPVESVRKNTKDTTNKVIEKIGKLKKQKRQLEEAFTSYINSSKQILKNKKAVQKIKIPSSPKLKDLNKINKKLLTQRKLNFYRLNTQYEKLARELDEKERDFKIGNEGIMIKEIDRMKTKLKSVSGKYIRKIEKEGLPFINVLLSKKHKFNLKQYNAMNKILKKTANSQYTVKFYKDDDKKVDKYLTLNNNKEENNRFLQFLTQNEYTMENFPENEYESGGIKNLKLEEFNKIEIVDLKHEMGLKPLLKAFLNKDGSFFNKINTSDIDLTRYQIYTKQDLNLYPYYREKRELDEIIDTEEYKNELEKLREKHNFYHIEHIRQQSQEECLIYTLKTILRENYPEDEYIAEVIKQKVKVGVSISMKAVGNICKNELKDFNVIFTKYKDTMDILGKVEYNKDKERKINICMYNNHFFVNEETKYSSFSIKHYEEIKHIDEWWDIWRSEKRNGKIRYKKNKNKCKLNTLRLVKLLDDKNIFIDDPILQVIDINRECERKCYLNQDIIGRESKLYNSDDQDFDKFRSLKHKGINYTHKGVKIGKNCVYVEVVKPYYADLECETFIKDNNEKVCEHKISVHNCVTCNKKHKALMAGICSQNGDDYKDFIVEEDSSGIIKKMFDYVLEINPTVVNTGKKVKLDGKEAPLLIYNNIVIYFHNVKYDWHVILNEMNENCDYKPMSICEAEGRIYSIKILYKGISIELRDSTKFLQMPLSAFDKTFNLGMSKKEAIAYNYYTKNNVSKPTEILCEEYVSYFESDEDKNIFYKVNKGWNAKTKFNPTEYYREYLKHDVLVLMKGLEKFNKTLQKGFVNINKYVKLKYDYKNLFSIYNFLTISSIAHFIMKVEGCYNGVCEMTGNIRRYCSKAARGGRVCVNPEFLGVVVEKLLADYDGVSLYPSAMERLCREYGIPIGKPKVLKEVDSFSVNEKWELKSEYDYYICSIKITNVGKKQTIPFISIKDENDILQYTNNPPNDYIFEVDRFTLEDWVKFHHIKFEFVNTHGEYGLCWNEGFNKRLGLIIKQIFNERLKAKNVKNKALSNTYKLIMNSVYGKTNPKERFTETLFVRAKTKSCDNNIERYISSNFRTIIECNKFNESLYTVKRYKIDRSYAMPQIACSVLSMSKRIMNEVFDTANDIRAPIYYTDTDSIHMNYNDVPRLEKEYKLRYDRVLNGKNLGQFHIDFDLDSCETSTIKSTKFLALGKKTYIDCLEGLDKNGNIVNGFHFRAKGITQRGINKLANDIFDGDVFKVYETASKKPLDIPMGLSFIYTKNGVHTRSVGIYRKLQMEKNE